MTSFAVLRDELRLRKPQRICDRDAVEAAVALVLVQHAVSSPELLLVKRAERDDDPWSGQMALPGGRREPQDRDLAETACREAHEETGVDLSVAELLGELDDLHPRMRVLPSIVVRPFVFALDRRPAVRLSPEVTLYVWASLSDLKAAGGVSTLTVRGQTLEVPSYRVGPHVVWGMTERIIKPLIDLQK